MKAYVGVTDGDWYRFLAERRIDEVNFWRPAGEQRGGMDWASANRDKTGTVQ